MCAVDSVCELNDAVFAAGNAIAEGEGLAGGGAAVAFFAGEFAHAGVEEPGSLRGGRFAFSGVRGGEVAIGKALGEDGFGACAVQGQAFGLLVFFVPVEAQPAQAFEDGLHAGVGVALDVGVVEAQHHGAVVVARVEPVEDERAGAADVEKAGGRGRKTNPRQRNGSMKIVRHREEKILSDAISLELRAPRFASPLLHQRLNRRLRRIRGLRRPCGLRRRNHFPRAECKHVQQDHAAQRE